MELYIGGFAQGKTEYVKAKYPNALWVDETDYELYVHAYLERKADGQAGRKVDSIGKTKKHALVEKLNGKVCVWNHFHLAVKEMLSKGYTSQQIQNAVFDLHTYPAKLVIICDEIGNGIVPMEKLDRIYREETGRILIEIAKESDRVERIICGMAQVIKSN